ncbi:MAG: hypothetical protein RBT50_09900, partial [Bacteroidales bacterium]|nr:hypothetical protein [Bacteroidales bacterium]
MKSRSLLSLLLLTALLSAPALMAQDAKPWYFGDPTSRPDPDPKAKKLPLIRVQGNKFVTPDGATVLFRGLSISDPDKIERQ